MSTNLDAGRLRLIFAADRLPAELVRVIEFLNDQMDPAEVIGVELPTFTSSADSSRTIAPRVVGVTARARTRKAAGGRGPKWNADRLMAEMRRQHGPEGEALARGLLEWGAATHSRVDWGRGTTLGSFCPTLDTPDDAYWFFYLYTSGQIEIQFQWLKIRPPFDELALRMELRDRMNRISGVDLPEDGLGRRPSFPLEVLYDPDNLALFKEAVEWGLAQVSRDAPSVRDSIGPKLSDD